MNILFKIIIGTIQIAVKAIATVLSAVQSYFVIPCDKMIELINDEEGK
ncbi:MAG: hypothetical protein LBM96_10785 [Methanobrevibacter sp.]|jgi:hypothetical protein|nr:hypothetical protein [Candidatus Methanoflexus mossambicus]